MSSSAKTFWRTAQQILYLLMLRASRRPRTILQSEACSGNKTPSIAQRNHDFWCSRCIYCLKEKPEKQLLAIKTHTHTHTRATNKQENPQRIDFKATCIIVEYFWVSLHHINGILKILINVIIQRSLLKIIIIQIHHLQRNSGKKTTTTIHSVVITA